MASYRSPKGASSGPFPHSLGQTQSAVLIDGSAVYLAARSLFEGQQLDYRALSDLLTHQVLGVTGPGPLQQTKWVMWTSASPQNQGQTKFLDFAENQLRWEVRRFSPADSFMVEPTSLLGLSTESRAASRLVRFDASIAFAIGRLADTHRIVVISDSFALADPLLRASRASKSHIQRPVIAFFGRALDSRWQRVLRTEGPAAPEFVDLDDFEQQLFGSQFIRPRKPAEEADTFVF